MGTRMLAALGLVGGAAVCAAADFAPPVMVKAGGVPGIAPDTPDS